MISSRRALSALILFISVAFCVLPTVTAAAPAGAGPYHIDGLSVESRGDFVLEPAKQETFLNPGDTVTEIIYVTDRVRGTTTFSIGIQDFKGTNDPNAPVAIVPPGQSGPDSGKDFLSVPASELTLSFGQRATIPVTVTVPKDASPGGYYAAVLISNEPTVVATSSTSVTGATRVISRLGTLFFIRVNGPANPQGQLQDFRINAPTSRAIYNSGPFTFEMLFNNTGNLYLTPYGTITIKNFLGSTIATVPVDAYYSLPQSLRYRDVSWNQFALFGRYTATLQLNRSYGGTTDTKTIAFWVIPWEFLLTAFAILFVVIFGVIFFLRTFEVRRK